jgi:hypothetical protein
LAVFESEVGRGEIKLNSICLDWEVAIRAEIFGIWGGDMADTQNSLKINLGCGERYLGGVNCDIEETVKADRYFDLEQFPYPPEEGCASEIFKDNVLEYVSIIMCLAQYG